MSNIDAQIKALLLKKKKIDYVNYVADLVKNDTKCVDFKDVQQEIVSKIEPFLIQLMDAIEKDTDVKTPKELGEEFSKEQKDALLAVANKLLNKAPTQANSSFSKETPPPSAPKTRQQELRELSYNDKMNFAMNNRHLGNKRVQVLNDQNAQIYGTVVGLDAPHVIVKTETGPTINVPLEKIVPA